jgi:phenylacetic acid degradation operon negative regulatory protein
MSITSEILKILNTNTKGSYKHIYSRLSENGTHPRFYKKVDLGEIKEQTLRTTLSRLKKQGLLKNENNFWKITKEGLHYLKKISARNHHFKIPFNSSTKNMIVIFDIPELHKKKRDWLRIELINLGFSMLQKSVWFGPSPLPKEFVKYVNEINVLPYIKFFKAEEKNIV